MSTMDVACTCPPGGPWHQSECPANTYTHMPEATIIATLKAARSAAMSLLDSIDVRGHFRLCEHCDDRGELSAACQQGGAAMLARINALEEALGRA